MRHFSVFFSSFTVCFSSLAMDMSVPPEIVDKFFEKKSNSLNQEFWDEKGVNIYGEDFLVIWVPINGDCIEQYKNFGFRLEPKRTKDRRWGQVRLPPGARVITTKTTNGTYRLIKNKRGRKLLAIRHYLTVKDSHVVDESQVIVFYKKLVKGIY